MLNEYHRILRENVKEIDWESVRSTWFKLMKFDSEKSFSFENFYIGIIKEFHENPPVFMKNVHKAHLIELPSYEMFNESSLIGQIQFYFASFQYFLQFDKLDSFVNSAKLDPEQREVVFSSEENILFDSICYLYSKMLYSLEEPEFSEYAPKLIALFSKQLVPKGHRNFDTTQFTLDIVYMAPVLFSYNKKENQRNIFVIKSNGICSVLDIGGIQTIYEINTDNLIGMISNDHVQYFDHGIKPKVDMKFPSEECASDAFTYSITPPKPGYSQLCAFLHSLPAFMKIDEIYKTESTNYANLPRIFVDNLNKCMTADSLELLLYAFTVDSTENKIAPDNINFFFFTLKEKFLSFVRTISQIYWKRAPNDGQLILRQNSQYSVFLRQFLIEFGSEYRQKIVENILGIIEKNGNVIKSDSFDNEDAINFIEKIFKPSLEIIFDSIPQMPKCLRQIVRIMFIRTAGFYVNQSSPFLVVPNLYLLRYVIPLYTEKYMVKFAPNPKFKKIASTLSASILSIFYRNPWNKDSYPALSNHNSILKELQDRAEDFSLRVIDFNDFECDFDKLSFKTDNLLKVLEIPTKRVTFMNLRFPNKYIKSHHYCVEIMQMIEESVYDFSYHEKQ